MSRGFPPAANQPPLTACQVGGDRVAESASGVLLLIPEGGGSDWTVLEVDSDPFENLSAASASDSLPNSSHPTLGAALHAAHDILTLHTEGRLPMMHEHVQESVREFVTILESNGYDRQTALEILLDMVDRKKGMPPFNRRKGEAPYDSWSRHSCSP